MVIKKIDPSKESIYDYVIYSTRISEFPTVLDMNELYAFGFSIHFSNNPDVESILSLKKKGGLGYE